MYMPTQQSSAFPVCRRAGKNTGTSNFTVAGLKVGSGYFPLGRHQGIPFSTMEFWYAGWHGDPVESATNKIVGRPGRFPLAPAAHFDHDAVPPSRRGGC